MLDPFKRQAIFEELYEHYEEFFNDLEDKLCVTYTGLAKAPDKDTPFIEEIYNKFARLLTVMQEHKAQLIYEANLYEEQEAI